MFASTAAFLVLIAAAQPGPITDWGAFLDTARVADRFVSYRGVKEASVTCGSSCELTRYKVVHLKPDMTRTEYYTPDSVSGTLIIRRGDSIAKYSPATRTWDRAYLPASSGADIQPLAVGDGEFFMEGTTAVAGRPTYVVAVKSRSSSGLIHRFWIDRLHELILATELKTTDGQLLGYSRFVSIQIEPGNIDKSSFKLPAAVARPSKSAKPSFRIAMPAYLPKGYSLTGVGSMVVDTQAVVHVQFSDGKTVLSLFQRKTKKDFTLSETRSEGTIVLTWAAKGTLFTLLGNAPSDQLRKIANSIRP
jgi:negative regulator of sigma E activity